MAGTPADDQYGQQADQGLFHRPGLRELRVVADALRAETVSGALLLAATIAALIWDNSGARESYEDFRHIQVGPAALGLHLSLEQWAADGLLAIFFFVAGLELKRELLAGEMRKLSAALVPIVAAITGMALPALVYLLINAGHPTASGWAIPCATDLAFALAVLAITGRFLPAALRAFLLTLAVVDDVGAVIIIAVAYSGKIDLLPLAGAAVLLVVFWLLQRSRITAWWIQIPLALVIWGLVHGSHVHATVAGIALGLLVPVTRGGQGVSSPHVLQSVAGQQQSPAEHLEHLVRPLSAGLAVPAFALLAAGVTVTGQTLSQVFTGRLGLGVLLGLVAAKAIGVFCGAYLTARFTHARLSPELDWADIFAVAVLSGIGFTVALLISDLAFGQTEHATVSKTAVVAASLIAGLLACLLLTLRNKHYRSLRDAER